MTVARAAGVAKRDMDLALDAFRSALGHDRVLTGEEQMRDFRDPYAFKGSDEFDAAAVVMPATVEQVQAVVRIANQYRVPLWTFGQGRNYTYGGPAPRVRGSVLVNLRGMNRVLEVNEEMAYAVVEPGVRWFDLADSLKEAGGRLWASIPDLGWGSVVGNTLEYGRGYTPYGDHVSNVCGMEVVLANGDVLRTGMGAMTGSKSWHLYQHSVGPSVDRLFMQSSLGIVTKMGVWLMRRPDFYLAGWGRFNADDLLEPVIDGLRELMLEGTIANYPLVGCGLGTGGSQENPVLGDGSENWTLRFALYGREEIVESHYRVVERVLGGIPGVEIGRRVFRGEERDSVITHDERVQCGIPDMELMDVFKTPYGEDTGHLDLSPVTPMKGSEALHAVKVMRALYARHGYPYLTGILLGPRSALHIATTFFNTADEERTLAAYEAYSEMVPALAKEGYPVYRTNIHHMDLVADQFEFGDHALRRFNETIKDAVDPNGILSPGKQGVWPRGRRKV
jgi:FAD/FMN-containing dehydrogenase